MCGYCYRLYSTLVTSIVVSGANELTVGGSTTLIANVLPNDATDNATYTSLTTITANVRVTNYKFFNSHIP